MSEGDTRPAIPGMMRLALFSRRWIAAPEDIDGFNKT
jgi:hypothetical protein